MPRLDARVKLTGAAVFGLGVQLKGMLTAVVARCSQTDRKNSQEWQLREFKLALLQTQPQGRQSLQFVLVSTKTTPWGELFSEQFNSPLTVPFMCHYITQVDELDARALAERQTRCVGFPRYSGMLD